MRSYDVIDHGYTTHILPPPETSQIAVACVGLKPAN